VGQPASYTLVVTNGGSAATTADATVTDTLPIGRATGTETVCSAAGRVVAYTVPSGLSHVDPGNTTRLTIEVTPTAAAANPVLNSASVVGGGDPACAVEGDCSDATSTPLVAPGLSVAKSAAAAEFVVGQPASYTLVVTNGGSAATTADATVTDTLPAGVTIDAAPGCSVAGQVVACTVPSGLSHVAPGNTASFTIDVTPTAAAANP